MMSSSDRRQYVRLAKPFRVNLRKFEFPFVDRDTVEASCRNISVGGMLLESPLGFGTGSVIQTSIRIPGLNKFHPGFFKVFENDLEQNLVAVAQVVRSVDLGALHELGLKFVDVYEDDWRALHAMIMKLSAYAARE
jgi:c-di-GMP-binding flagellar brake protein YcgR